MDLDPKKIGLDEKNVKSIQNCFEKHPSINTVVLYGSRAKGNYRNGSDINLCFKGRTLETSLILKLSSELDDLLLPYTFDLSIYKDIKNKDLLEHIDRVGIVFYRRRGE